MSGKKIFQVLIIAFAVLVFAHKAAAGGFGVSPSQIISSNLLKGSVYEQTITFVQSEPSADLNAEVVIDAPEIAGWLSIDKGMSFVLPKGVQQFPIKVKITVPENASEGKYRGYIRVNTKPATIVKAGEGSTVSINYGGRIDLDLTVGNNVVEEFNIMAIKVENIENGWPFLASVKIQNTGNVPVKLDRATFDLFDKYNFTRLGYAQTEDFESVPAYSTKEMLMKFPIDLKVGLGEYSASVKVFKDGKMIKEAKAPFRVAKEGTLGSLYGNDFKGKSGAFDFIKPFAVYLIVLLGLAVALFIIKKKKIKKSA